MSRPKTPADVGSLARAYTKRSIEILGGLAEKAETDAVRAAACVALLDRGWGKPKQTQIHTGADGEGPITFVVRHITEGSSPPKK